MYGNCGVGELWCRGTVVYGNCGVWGGTVVYGEYIRLMEVESVVCSVTLIDLLLAQLSDSS